MHILKKNILKIIFTNILNERISNLNVMINLRCIHINVSTIKTIID